MRIGLPYHEAVKWRKKFAWIPMPMENGEWRFLAHYLVRQPPSGHSLMWERYPITPKTRHLEGTEERAPSYREIY